MKKLKNNIVIILIFGISAINVSCSEDDNNSIENNENLVDSLELNRPEIILNEIAKGDFNNGIFNNIVSINNGTLYASWNYTVNNLGKISQIIHNTNNSCEQRVISFYYNEVNLINEVISVRTNTCNNFTSKWIYNYNYEMNLLVSINGKSYYSDENVTDKLISVSENYFSYQENGKIDRIYSNGRPEYEPLIGFNEKKLIYDNNNNVIEVKTKLIGDDDYYQKFTFEYNEVENPFKGFYINSNIQTSLPNLGFESTLGPNFLSTNFIKKVTIEYLNNNPNQNIKVWSMNMTDGLINDYGLESNNSFRTFLSY